MADKRHIYRITDGYCDRSGSLVELIFQYFLESSLGPWECVPNGYDYISIDPVHQCLYACIRDTSIPQVDQTI